jgi:hypothetical protein
LADVGIEFAMAGRFAEEVGGEAEAAWLEEGDDG